MEKPKLLSASFVFTQESNCLSPNGIEEIAIDCLSDLMIEKGELLIYTSELYLKL
jgi:hypothetical protein